MRSNYVAGAVVAYTFGVRFALGQTPLSEDTVSTAHVFDKRQSGYCLDLGIGCIKVGNPSLDTVQNCGSCCNSCSSSWANGYGRQCVSGRCMPGQCNNGYALSSSEGGCVSIETTQNW